MSVVECVRVELVAQLRVLLASVPRPGSPVAVVAWWLLRKAEILDFLGVVDATVTLQAKEMATRARYQARALTGDPGTI